MTNLAWARAPFGLRDRTPAPIANVDRADLAAPTTSQVWRFVDSSLIEACQQGDQAALQELFETCQGRVYSLARHFSGNDTTARDIAQEVFLSVFQSIGQFRRDARFETWLYRIVVNACLKERRRWRRLVAFGDDGVRLPTTNQSGESSLIQRQVSAEVRAAVATLRPKLRLPLLLKHVEGLSYYEIAEILGCSMGTVASRLNRARGALADKLGHLRGAEAVE